MCFHRVYVPVLHAASSPHTLLLICGLPDVIKQSDFSTAAHQWDIARHSFGLPVCFVSTRQETIRLQCMRAVHCAQVLWPPNHLAFSAFHPCSGGGSHQANDLSCFQVLKGGLQFTCNC